MAKLSFIRRGPKRVDFSESFLTFNLTSNELSLLTVPGHLETLYEAEVEFWTDYFAAIRNYMI